MKRPNMTTNEVRVVKAIQAGMPRDHVIKKYKISQSTFDKLAQSDVAITVQADEAISKLSSNKALIDAAEKLNVPFIEELHGLARLDQNMQQTAIAIINKLQVQLETISDTDIVGLQTIIQSFILMRKSMFSAGPQVVNNFNSMSAITNNRV